MKNEVTFNGITFMDIESKSGTKVRFIAQKTDSWGVDPKNAKHLVLGQIYTVDYTDIHSWHTKVYLQEVPGIEFSSIWFEEVK